MAAYNKTLGRFQLTGIPPAPRGVPQIEVTFDIDANGIVHVSAKDQATGNEQKVSITASTNLSEEDINQAIKDAEAHAAEDKKRKEEIEVRNNAESLVYNSQKTLDELGDKVSGEEKAKVEAEVENVRKALEGTNVDTIKDAEAHAAEDKKRKEEIEVRNNAESLVYNSQKTLDELGDKVSGEEKAKVEAEVENVRKALEGTNVDEIKDATEKLTKVFYELSEKLYSAQAAQGAGTADAAGSGEAKEGTVYDADYKVEDDGNNN